MDLVDLDIPRLPERGANAVMDRDEDRDEDRALDLVEDRDLINNQNLVSDSEKYSREYSRESEKYLREIRNDMTRLMYSKDGACSNIALDACDATPGCKYYPSDSPGGEGCFFDSELMQAYADLVCTKLKSENRLDLQRLAKYYGLDITGLSKDVICKLIGDEISTDLTPDSGGTTELQKQLLEDPGTNEILENARAGNWSMSTAIEKLREYFRKWKAMDYVKALLLALIVVGIVAAAVRTVPYAVKSSQSTNKYIDRYSPARTFSPPEIREAQREMINFRNQVPGVKGGPITCFISDETQLKLVQSALEVKLDYCTPKTAQDLFSDSLELPAQKPQQQSWWEWIFGRVEELTKPLLIAAPPETKPEVQQLIQHLRKHGTNWNARELPKLVKTIALDGQLQFVKILLNDIITEVIPKNRKMTDITDFKKTGLIIGQQLCGLGAFRNPLETIAGPAGARFSEENLSHCGIYIGNGLVWEVGGGEFTQFEYLPENQLTTAGISSLGDWSYDKIYVITTPDDADPNVVAERLARLIKVTGPMPYSIVWRNCQTLANFVTFGTKFSQPEGVMYIGVGAVTVLGLSIRKLGQWALQKIRGNR